VSLLAWHYGGGSQARPQSAATSQVASAKKTIAHRPPAATRAGTLSAGILPDGGSMATVNRDGSIYAKVGWWRGLPGQLVIWGRRLDAHAPPLRAAAGTVLSYGSEGFVPSGLTFPTVGCWRVSGGVRHARLTFVVRVTKLSRKTG
jgi:hypothetical protein